MAFPENQVSALHFFGVGRVQSPAETALLHVAVARAAGASRGQRYLHQARAIDAEAALATPQVGCADKPFGHRDEIVLEIVDTADMPQRQIPALACGSESTFL